MSKTIYIYGLSDPRNDIIRYVGKSLNVERRLTAHLKNSNACKHCHSWLVKLKGDGVDPKVTILETLESDANWIVSEKKWIKHFKEQGNNLTNLTDGGEGGTTYGRLGKKNSPEHIKKCSRPGVPVKHTPEGNKNRIIGIRNYYKRMADAGITITKAPCSESRKQKIGLANRGRVLPMTQARLDAIERRRGKPAWNRGIPKSEETKAKISATKKGIPWNEARRLAQSRRSIKRDE